MEPNIEKLIINELIEELKQTPEQVQYQVLNFVRFLAHERRMEAIEAEEDEESIRLAHEEMKEHGTIPWEQVEQELGLPE